MAKTSRNKNKAALTKTYLHVEPIWLPEDVSMMGGKLTWNYQMFADMPDAEMLALGLDISTRKARIRSLEAFLVYGGASWLDDGVSLSEDLLWPCTPVQSDGETIEYQHLSDLMPGSIEHTISSAHQHPLSRDDNFNKEVPRGIGKLCLKIADHRLGIAFYDFDEVAYCRRNLGIVRIFSREHRRTPLWHVAMGYMLAGHLPPARLVMWIIKGNEFDAAPEGLKLAMRHSLITARAYLDNVMSDRDRKGWC